MLEFSLILNFILFIIIIYMSNSIMNLKELILKLDNAFHNKHQRQLAWWQFNYFASQYIGLYDYCEKMQSLFVSFVADLKLKLPYTQDTNLTLDRIKKYHVEDFKSLHIDKELSNFPKHNKDSINKLISKLAEALN